MNILETIVEYKRKEVDAQQSRVSIDELCRYPGFSQACFPLRQFLADDTRTGIIAEFKRKSPSKGNINCDADVYAVTQAYAAGGASALSVLTDREFFGGSLEDLSRARQNQLPILRKDFMVDAYQFYEAKAYGADIVLLIAACLTSTQVKRFAALAKTLGLQVLLEIHNEHELGHICDEVDFVGINNRDLKTFRVDIATSLGLVEKIASAKPVIAESGINSIDTILQLRNAGFEGFLVGENFMKQPNPGRAFSAFATELKEKRI